jgi:transcription initiation factor TFIID TATA-box-binding protein
VSIEEIKADEQSIKFKTEMSYTNPEIHNIVSTTQISCKADDGTCEHPRNHNIDINHLHSVLPCCSYDKRKFAAITIKLANPTCTALLFTSGKLVITGNRTWHESVTASLFLAHILSITTTGVQFKVESCKIQNIVARADLHLKEGEFLNLDALQKKYDIYSTYTKRVFPGLILRLPDIPVVLLCFKSGKVVVTGGKKKEDTVVGWKHSYKILSKFIERDNQSPSLS